MSTRRALLIGIDAYTLVRQLQGCVNDVLAVYDFLQERADFKVDNIELLVSPHERMLPLGASWIAPTRAHIQLALERLIRSTQPDDEVLLYYSGHGVNIANPHYPSERVGALVPQDADLLGENLLSNRAIYAFISRLLALRSRVTVILDACHSGGATRDIDSSRQRATAVREIMLDRTTPELWGNLQAGAANFPGTVTSDASLRSRVSSSGWRFPHAATSLIVLTACRDSETTLEIGFPAPDGPRYGVLTAALLNALQKVNCLNSSVEACITWQDLYPIVVQNVRSLSPGQTPTIEGYLECPVFGSAWTVYEPGFTISVAENGIVTADGGTIHGLDEGARLAIYPPRTASFSQADRSGITYIVGVVEGRSSPIESRLAAPQHETIANLSRARLLQPSFREPVVRVSLHAAVPQQIRSALFSPAALSLPALQLRLLPGALPLSEFVAFVDQGAGELEIRPASGIRAAPAQENDASLPALPLDAGWVLVPYTSAETNITWNDVIGWAPRSDRLKLTVTGQAANKDPELVAENVIGLALGQGLVHWARYASILNRRHNSIMPGRQVSAILETGTNMYADWDDPTSWRAVSLSESDTYFLSDATPLRLRVAISEKATGAVAISVLLCSNDGNTAVLWPPPGHAVAQTIQPGAEHRIGLLGPNGFRLGVDQRWQTTSRYTFKIFVAPPNTAIGLHTLLLNQTVQDTISYWINGIGVREVKLASATSLSRMDDWGVVEVPVVVSRSP